MVPSSSAAAAADAATTSTTKSRSFHHYVITLDTAISQSVHSLFHSIIPRSFLHLLEYSADFRVSFPLALSLYFTPIRPTYLIPFLLGLLLDLLLIGLVKSIFRRSRPHYNPNMIPAVSLDNFSFPSGHASRVFFIAGFSYLFNVLIGNNWFLFGVWAWALLTSVSRVLLGRHFVLDVFAGACFGVVEAMIVFSFLRNGTNVLAVVPCIVGSLFSSSHLLSMLALFISSTFESSWYTLKL